MWQLTIVFVALLWPNTSHSRLVNTLQGPVRGNRVNTVDPRTQAQISYDEFLTIPFAEPPIGQNRFAPPKPAKPWKEYNDSIPYKRVCYQTFANAFGLIPDIDGDEDCLYLNVYVPVVAEADPLPVMVWVTGGAFLAGGGIWYGPNFWMAHGIIVVTINYRVGPFGYLTLGVDEAPGNVGMLDQRLALEWVQDNIDRFGGDPSKVTLAGESAGSFSAMYHLVSPGSKGLFNRVIAQSGVGGLAPGFHHWSAAQGVRLGTEVATLLGCISLTVAARLQCLKEVSAEALSLVELEDGVISQPVVDTFASQPFLPQDPALAFTQGDFNTEVDVLLGANKEEGYLFTQAFLTLNNTILPLIMNHWDTWGPILLLQKHFIETTQQDIDLAYQILEHYCGTTNITVDHIGNITDMFTDSFFWVGVDKYIDLHLSYSNKPVYHYIYHHINDISQITWAGVPTLPGVSHADELWVEWGPFLGLNRTLSQEDKEASLHLTELWSSFVKYGDPTPPNVGGLTWEPVSKDSKKYLKLDSTLSMVERPDTYMERMQYWRNIFPKMFSYLNQ